MSEETTKPARPYSRDAYWRLTDDEEADILHTCGSEFAADEARRALRVARFFALYPAIDCWIHKVDAIELFLGGIRRALVVVRDATITYFDAEGRIEAAAFYLCSESPYGIVEAHLGVSRVAEFRDLSADTNDFMDPQVRDYEEGEVARFREKFDDEDREIIEYLRRAVRRDREFESAELIPSIRSAEDRALLALTETVRGHHETALVHARAALGIMPETIGSRANRSERAYLQSAITVLERALARPVHDIEDSNWVWL